jgi:uncharacterized protein (TIGR00369 family)
MAETAEDVVRWHDPAILVERVRAEAGAVWLAAVVAGALPPPNVAEVMGFRLTAAEPGRAVLEAEPDERFCNPLGVVAGGYAQSLLDLALGCAVHATLPPGGTCPTLTQSTAFHRPLQPDGGRVRAEARLLSAGRRVATAEADLRDAAGRLCATATATFLLLLPS